MNLKRILLPIQYKGLTMRNFALVMGVAILFISSPVTVDAQEPPMEEDSKIFMRAKLKHSQAILESLVTEDFDGVTKGAQELSLLSLATQWQVLQTPEYVTRSNEFRREVDALSEAAKQKNLDGATLAFVKVTMNCVECHKFVRSTRQAKLDRFRLEAIVTHNRFSEIPLSKSE